MFRSCVPVGHGPGNLRIVSAPRTVRRATHLSPPPGLPSVTSFSAPPWDPRGRLLADALTLSVLTVVAFSRCRSFAGFAYYGLWLPVLAPHRPPMAPPM